MKRINNVTIGIDFSATARNAYRYAIGLAAELQADLTVVHVKENTIMQSDVVTSQGGDQSQLIQDIQALLDEENTPKNKSVPVKIKVFSGNPVTVFTELHENTGTDIIVIGTTGLSDVLTRLFGSTSLNISKQAHCPVVLVPRDAKWKSISQLVFASDYDSLTSINVRKINSFAMNLQANIHFVNVRNYDPILEPKQKDINWNELLVGNDFNLDYEKSTLYGNDTVAEINKYNAAYCIDMIAFVSKSRGFWGNLAHKSITENMALASTIPLMIMHLDDEI